MRILILSVLVVAALYAPFTAGKRLERLVWMEKMESVQKSNAESAAKLQKQYDTAEKKYQTYVNDSGAKIHELRSRLQSKPVVSACHQTDAGRIVAALDPGFNRMLIQAVCDTQLPRATTHTATPCHARETTSDP